MTDSQLEVLEEESFNNSKCGCHDATRTETVAALRVNHHTTFDDDDAAKGRIININNFVAVCLKQQSN